MYVKKLPTIDAQMKMSMKFFDLLVFFNKGS